MAKLEDTLSRFFGGSNGLFNNGTLIIIVVVFLILCTDILDNFLENDNIIMWIVLVALLLFNFDDSCC